jgi:iron(III) transport system substrate-binding protein
MEPVEEEPLSRAVRHIMVGGLAATAILTAGCGSSSKSAAPTTSSRSTPAGVAARNVSSATVPLVVYSAQGYDSKVTVSFQKATGIPVELDDDSTGPLLTKVAAERDNPQWGVLWVDGDTAFAALDKQGQLLDYVPPVQFTTVGAQLQPADHAYTCVSTTVMAALIYNAAKVSAVPTSYEQLTTAPYKGKVGMNDPSQSGPTFPFIAGIMNQLGGESHGVAAGEAFFERLKANGLQVFPTNGDTLHALETGQIDYGLIQSSAASGEVATAPRTSSYDPKTVYLPVSTLLPGVVGIDKGASRAEQAEAKRFVQYVLSPAGQSVMQTGDPTGDSLFWPVIPGESAVADVPPFPTEYQRLDPYFWGPLEGQVNIWFDTYIK